MATPTTPSTSERLASAGPWWIVLGLGGVVLSVCGAPAPLLASLTLVGMGADADLGRRLAAAARAATDAHPIEDEHTPLVVRFATALRWAHAVLYAVLIFAAWSALLDLASRGEGPLGRLTLAGDLLIAALLLSGYARLCRRVD